MNEADLERRYRRLLAWYPWSHRRVYEDEMLAVLVTAARPGQRWPTLGEAGNLVASGLRARAGAAVTAAVSPPWRAAATVFGLFAAIVLLSQRVVRLFDIAPPGSGAYLRALGWAAVVLAVLVGLRRSAATIAWLTALGEVVLVARQYGGDPVSAVHLMWPLALGLFAAAALSVATERVGGVLRLRRVLLFAGGVALAQTVLLTNRHAQWNWREAGTFYANYGLAARSEAVFYLLLAAVLVGFLASALAWLTLPVAIRWRALALATPVITVAALVKVTLSGWEYSNWNMGHPIYLVPIQWTLLAVLPLASLGIAAALVERRELTARLSALGRAADRDQATG
ncbi:hypothetical protein AB0J74_01975 [Asanoa sp. NPDC049573]|uniref:hypothetical protein n=1 Tax=Asanoa sp. NPDC049573 TaxID=3155396 RepID=UPI003442EF94